MEILFSSWLLISLVASLPLLYWYFTRNFNYWSKLGIKGPKSLPIVGNAHVKVSQPMSKVEIKWLNEYGLVYGIYNGSKPVLTVGDPEILKDMLVRDIHIMGNKPEGRWIHPIIKHSLIAINGEDWKRVRSISSPTFTSGKMRRMYPMVKECVDELIQVLEGCARAKGEFSAKPTFGNLTMDVIAACAFGTKANCQKTGGQESEYITNAKEILHPGFCRILGQLVLSKSMREVFKLYTFAKESANQFFLETARQIIKLRKNEGIDSHNDFIALILRSMKNSSDGDVVRDESDANESHHLNEGREELDSERKTFSSVTNKSMTEEEVLALSWVIFVAGYETTGSTLSSACYELALNPDIQQRLYEEVMSAVDSDGHIDYDRLTQLSYLDAVVSETLRMHTPVMRIPRQANQDYHIEKLGITLKRGQLAEIPLYAIHHNEDFYPNPFRFDPDRFMPENRHKLIPYSYLPFVSGPRNCIGMRFGLMEAKLALAEVVRHYRLFRTERTAVPLIERSGSLVYNVKEISLGIGMRN